MFYRMTSLLRKKLFKKHWKTIKLVEHQSYHVLVQYTQGNQNGPVNGSRFTTDRKYKFLGSNRTNSLPVKLRKNKNSNTADNDGVIKSKSKKETIIIRDSMIKHVNDHEVSRDNSLKIRYHPGATTDNIIDYVRSTACKKPDMIIILTSTNEIQNKVNTLQKVRKLITVIKEIDVNNEVEIAFLGLIHHDDQDFEEEIKKINRKLENLCKDKGIIFINNNNIDGSCLNRSKLHLNKSGTDQLVKKFLQTL